MNIPFIFLFLFLSTNVLVAQDMNASQLLEKSINYHDPEQRWHNWQATFALELEMPERPNRLSRVQIDNESGDFHLIVARDGHQIERVIEAGRCKNFLNRETPTDTALIRKFQLNCDRTKMYKNYYTYLYGLPMKLEDEGTILQDRVEAADIAGASYWRIKVNYEEEVGDDTWYFYFDKKTFALKAYQFYHDESKNDGEYILLKGEKTIDGIIVPKDRTWYYNSDNKLLGTDFMKD